MVLSRGVSLAFAKTRSLSLGVLKVLVGPDIEEENVRRVQLLALYGTGSLAIKLKSLAPIPQGGVANYHPTCFWCYCARAMLAQGAQESTLLSFCEELTLTHATPRLPSQGQKGLPVLTLTFGTISTKNASFDLCGTLMQEL